MLGLACLIVAISVFVMPWVIITVALIQEERDERYGKRVRQAREEDR